MFLSNVLKTFFEQNLSGPTDHRLCSYFFTLKPQGCGRLRYKCSFTIRPRPRVSGFFWIRILFFPDTPFAHTHPVNPICESGNFWIRYFFGSCVDSRILILLNPMTLHDRVQSLQSSRPRGYKTTWQPTKTFLLFLLGWEFLVRLLICILVCLWSFIFYTHF